MPRIRCGGGGALFKFVARMFQKFCCPPNFPIYLYAASREMGLRSPAIFPVVCKNEEANKKDVTLVLISLICNLNLI